MITRRTKLQLTAFAVVAVLGMSYLGFTYVGLDRVVLGNGYEVAADFSDSGGIFVNAEVTYRGTAVGRVSDMELVEDGVRVVLSIDPDSDPIPVDTSAVVATRSAVGEQYVDLRPETDQGPFLEDGAVIPQDRTSIPVPIEQLLVNVDDLATSIDEDNLRILVDELGKAFAGAGDDLGRLIDNGDVLLARAEQSLPETLRLITDGRTVLETQVASRSAIQQWAAELRTFTDTLVEIDPDLRNLLATAPDAGAQLEQLVRDAGPGLGSLLRNIDILNDVTNPRLPAVEQLLVTYPDVISGNFTVVHRDEDGVMRSHFGFVLNAGDPHACTTGYIPTTALPSEGAVAAADVDAVRCGVINGADPNAGDGYDENGSNIRGEQNIGRSGGTASSGPQGSTAGQVPPLTGGAPDLGGILGQLLSANPFAFTTE
jgi:virulence factor Mce-like protein